MISLRDIVLRKAKRALKIPVHRDVKGSVYPGTFIETSTRDILVDELLDRIDSTRDRSKGRWGIGHNGRWIYFDECAPLMRFEREVLDGY